MGALELNTNEMNLVQGLDLQALNTLDHDKAHLEWLLERKGRFTASEIHRLCTTPTKPHELPKGAETYVIEKVAEALTDGLPEMFTSASMQWGKDHELEAIQKFAKARKLKVQNIGDDQKFVKYGRHCGCTPDGLGVGYGVETKCPNSSTHVVYKSVQNGDDLKKVKPEYYWQIQSSMLFTKKKFWYFVSYDPRFSNTKHHLHIAKIERNEFDIEFMKHRLELAIEMKQRLIKEFK